MTLEYHGRLDAWLSPPDDDWTLCYECRGDVDVNGDCMDPECDTHKEITDEEA